MELIEETKIEGGGDFIVWAPSLKGLLNLKDRYEFTRKTKYPWNWSNIVWFSGRILRHSFITWLALNGVLKTLVRLKQWRVVDVDDCVHCWQQGETKDHLFFRCRFARRI